MFWYFDNVCAAQRAPDVGVVSISSAGNTGLYCLHLSKACEALLLLH